MFMRVFAVLIALTTASAAAAQTEYLVRPGDQLLIEVIEDSGLNRTVLVLPDGSISFPLAGAVAAGGKTTTGVASAVSSALSPNFASPPTVTVSVQSLAAQRATGGGVSSSADIYFMGEVAKPGRIQVQSGTTLLQALALSGGFSRFAATKRIQLRRTDASGQEKVFTINFRDIENGKSGLGSTVLADGDVIVVPERRLFE